MTVKQCLDIVEKLKQKSLTSADEVAETLEEFLEDIAMDDGFGTERQLDPRGDGRDMEYDEDEDEDEEVEYPSMFVSDDEQSQHERNIEVLENLSGLLKDPDEEYLRESFIEIFEVV